MKTTSHKNSPSLLEDKNTAFLQTANQLPKEVDFWARRPRDDKLEMAGNGLMKM